MSYPGYTPAPQAPAQNGATATTSTAATTPQTPTTSYAYPYHPAAYGHPGTPGAYSYPAGAYQTGVTSYGWPYPYSYVSQHPAQAAAQAQAVAAASAHLQQRSAVAPQGQTQTPTQPPTTAHIHTVPPPAPPQRAATFSAYTPSYSRESIAAQSSGGGGRGAKRQSNFKGLFHKELKNLMYGFGDDRNPANDTVTVMEEILIEYITDVCQQAAGPSKKSRLSIDDLRRALSNPADAKKLARLEELLFMQEDIKRARAQFEESDIHNPKGI